MFDIRFIATAFGAVETEEQSVWEAGGTAQGGIPGLAHFANVDPDM